MRYGEFTFGMALRNLQIAHIVENEAREIYTKLSHEFAQEKKIAPSDIFRHEFQFGQEMYRSVVEHSEEMRNSQLIKPFLWEIWRQHLNLYLWEGMDMNVYSKRRLTGKHDYFVTKKAKIPQPPYCIIVEAKKDDFERGWGQALAAMKAAQILNKKQSAIHIPIYGIVSTGVYWQFGKLAENYFVFVPERWIGIFEPENPVDKILTCLDIIFSECEKNVK